MLTAVAASIGTPSIPGVGLVVLSLILGSVGIPTSGIALIMGVDRILDMSRTAVNVTGDLVTCKVVDRLLGGKVEEKNEEIASQIKEKPVEKAGEKTTANSDF